MQSQEAREGSNRLHAVAWLLAVIEETYTVIIATEDTVGQKFMIGMAHAKAMIMNGEMVKLTVGPSDDPIGVKQRGFLHASVLPQIADQVWVTNPANGKRERFVADTWKEYYHKLYIPDKWAMRKMPGAKKKTPHRERVSSEQIGVRRYSEWIDKIIDHATAEWGVQFVFKPSEREGVRFVSKPRKENVQ